jgi:hypothetical protein
MSPFMVAVETFENISKADHNIGISYFTIALVCKKQARVSIKHKNRIIP